MSIQLEHKFNAAADALWAIVGTPDRTDWVPGVSECKYDGEIRRLVMQGAGEIAERILNVDESVRLIQYSCIESVPPLDEHLAEIQVLDEGPDGCCMVWKTTVRPEAVEPFIEQQMHAAISQLEKLLS